MGKKPSAMHASPSYQETTYKKSSLFKCVKQVGELTSFGLRWLCPDLKPYTITKVEFYIGLSNYCLGFRVIPTQ